MSRQAGLGRPTGTDGQHRAALATVHGTGVRGLEAGWCSHPGRVRGGNEDAIAVAALPRDAGLLVVLSDGLGGHAGGEVASRLVCERVLRSADGLTPERAARARYDLLYAALLDADRLVRAAAAGQDELGDMGATVAVAAVTPSQVVHLHAGDSRVYVFRQGRTRYRTQDQTVVGLLERHGHLTAADASRHPQRHRLLSCLGGGGDRSRCDPAPPWPPEAATSEAQQALAPHDTLLLCSDGLTSQVPDEAIEELVGRADLPVSTIATTLVEAALAAGGHDNVTVCVVRVTEA